MPKADIQRLLLSQYSIAIVRYININLTIQHSCSDNIYSGEPVSVRKLVERWLHENNWKIELNLGHYPYPDYEPMAFWGDSSRIDSINVPE
ncbi:MAG: hypothetical protein V3S86_00280 [Nitrosomonadaceae bacterium]